MELDDWLASQERIARHLLDGMPAQISLLDFYGLGSYQVWRNTLILRDYQAWVDETTADFYRLAADSETPARRRQARVRAGGCEHGPGCWSRAKASMRPCCVRCGATKNIHADHIVPLAKGGLHCGQSNQQPLCARCNSKKGASV